MKEFGYMGHIWGMPVIRSDYVPKKKVPILPRTDDMRDMVEALIESGQAKPQHKEVDQVFMVNGKIVGNPRTIGILSSVC